MVPPQEEVGAGIMQRCRIDPAFLEAGYRRREFGKLLREAVERGCNSLGGLYTHCKLLRYPAPQCVNDERSRPGEYYKRMVVKEFELVTVVRQGCSCPILWLGMFLSCHFT